MSEKFLHRKDAPFGDEVWNKIDQTVVEAAKSQLCGRRLIKIQGPYGLGLKTLPTSECPVDEKLPEGVQMAASCAIPLVAVRAGFTLAARDIAAFEQSALPLDLSEAANAAINCAKQEDALVFNGSKKLAMRGLLNAEGAGSMKLKPWNNIGTAAENIIEAVTALDDQGFHGPYALALAPKLYNLLFRRYPQNGSTELEHIKEIVTDGIVKAPVIASGGVLLCTGGPFASIVLGQDLMAGFVGPANGHYDLLVCETLTLWLKEPKSICVLK
jgi:uncharacterized linocin/CFP29 family protein